MARNLIFHVCLGLMVVSVAVATRFQPPLRSSVNSRQAFVRWIRPRPRPQPGPGTSSARPIQTANGIIRPYKGPGIPSSTQIQAFFQRNPAARQRSQSIQARAAAFASRQFTTGQCSCNQVTCVPETLTLDAYMNVNNDICVVTAPMGGYDYTQCTSATFEMSCPELAACGMGTCQDVGVVINPVAALCIVDLATLNFYFENINVPLPSDCCCA